MRSTLVPPSSVSVRPTLLVLALLALTGAGAAQAQPAFSKTFLPDVIGPGSVSTLQFDIANGSGSPVTDLAFSDILPAGVTIADPANASSNCGDMFALGAPDGGTTITFSDGEVAGSSSCTITVDVTSSTPGLHSNTSGDLTSSAGNSGTATDDLTVDLGRPGFSKGFDASSVPLGSRVTLTFTIDNSLNAGEVFSLSFTDTLPSGMVVADPSNAATSNCSSGFFTEGTFDAVPGSSVVSASSAGGFAVFAVAAGGICTFTVDVIAGGGGTNINVSGELTSSAGSSGKASAELDVTVTEIALAKSFTDDPVPPGGTATMDLTVSNFSRTSSATAIAFDDDLGAALAGLTFASLLSNDCGGSVAGVGTSMIMFSGGTLGPEGSCTVSVSLSVPPATVPGAYPNTTSAVSATIDGSPVVGNMASDDLFVEPVPVLTKEFLDAVTLMPNPVVDSGDDVVMRFTITNTSTTSGATDITFLDVLSFLPFPVSAVLPSTPCGAGSSASLVFVDPHHALLIDGGTLDPAPGAGATCTFDVTLSIAAEQPPGTYVNTTEEITATVDGDTRTGDPASDDFTVIAAPLLSKSFTDDPVPPGGTVTLEFTLEASLNLTDDATGITFTDDLTFLTGLTANVPPTPDPPCGAGSSLTASAGDTLLTLMGGTLMPGESCTFSVTLNVPIDAPGGSSTNTTSGVGATIGVDAATSPSATDDLQVAGLVFSKEFLGDPVLPGATLPLRFTIENVDPVNDADILFFSDNLNAELPGLAATGGATADTCGGSLSGTTSLTYLGGSVTSGNMCIIEVDVLVPGGADDGTYANVTSSLLATIDGNTVTIDPAVDDLIVDSNLLSLVKEFTDDPVAPGDPVTLELTLTNLDPVQPASSIDFTDDLDAALTDLTFASELSNDCGATVAGTGTTTITVTGASLAAGGSCTIGVSLSVPAAADPGLYTNTIDDLTGTIGGLSASSAPASDDLELVNLLLFDKAFDGPTTAGATAMLTFTITNPGSETVNDIGFTDSLDSVVPGLVATNLPLSDVCGSGSLLSGTSFLSLTDGSLPPSGGTCSFDVELMVPVDAAAGDFLNITSDLLANGLFVAEPATDTLTVLEADLEITKTDGVTSAAPGTSITYTIVATNNGPSDVSSVSVTDSFPFGLSCTFTSAAADGATGNTAAGSGDLAETLSMPAGSSVTYTVDCMIPSSATGTLSNTATIASAVVSDLTPGNNSATDDDTLLVPEADISVTKTDGLTSALPGQGLTYMIVVANAGPSDDPSVSLTDSFPAALTCTYTSAAAGGATGNTAAGSGDLAETLSMPAGSSVTYTVDCTIDSSATGTLSNTATATASAVDPVPGNNSATDDDTVLVPTADLAVTKDGPASVTVGESLSYTLTVDNNGPSDATNTQLDDPTPTGLTLNSATAPCAGGFPCALGTVAAGGSVVVTVTFDVPFTYSGPDPIENTATVSSDAVDGTPANDSATASTDVVTDDLPPLVTDVSTAAGPLAVCDTVRIPIATLEVTIEDELTPILNADDPASYLLVSAGPDGDFSTTACGGAAGDDVEIEILSLTLSGADPLIVDIDLNLEDAVNGIAPGLYRFFVCDTVTDASGNVLDGDGDSNPGGDFELSFFRADPFNLFENGNFDDCPVTLDPWTASATAPNMVVPGAAGLDDVDGSPFSASARFSHSADAPSSLAQCVAAEGDTSYGFMARLRFDPLVGALAIFQAACELFDGIGCAGASLGSNSSSVLLEPGLGDWVLVATGVDTPAGTASALCDFTVEPLGSEVSFDLFLDALFLGENGLIFSDGFESGDVSAWSASVP